MDGTVDPMNGVKVVGKNDAITDVQRLAPSLILMMTPSVKSLGCTNQGPLLVDYCTTRYSAKGMASRSAHGTPTDPPKVVI